MKPSAEFFAEFPPVSREEWLTRVAKDLKGKPLEDLYWHLNDTTVVDPFGHPDAQPTPPAPLLEAPDPWQINEDIEGADNALANRQALEALAAGAESLHFRLESPSFTTALEELLQGVHPGYISLHFSGPGMTQGPAAVLAALAGKAKAQQPAPDQWHGSLYYDPAAAPGGLRDWRYLTEMIEYARAEMPGFRCITVDGRSNYAGPANAAAELAGLLRRGRDYLEKLTERGLGADAAAGQMQFSLYIGKSYFVEIAKLRAFNLLWLNVLKAYDTPLAYPVLDVRFAPEVYTDDLYTNMIRATTMAMSAVVGGAKRLTVRPYDDGRAALASYAPAFGRRIARNVQHLLKEESGFAELADPAAGSYYIEKLTAQLAEAAWKGAC